MERNFFYFVGRFFHVRMDWNRREEEKKTVRIYLIIIIFV